MRHPLFEACSLAVSLCSLCPLWFNPVGMPFMDQIELRESRIDGGRQELRTNQTHHRGHREHRERPHREKDSYDTRDKEEGVS